MRKEIFFGLATIAGALLAYYLKFDEGLGLSNDKGDWGVFGDFVGGLSNPIITFITMCMLIKSIDLQREANNAVIEQNDSIKKTEEIRSFESTFFNLIEIMKQEFSNIHVVNSEIDARGSAAITHIEQYLRSIATAQDTHETQTSISKEFEQLDDSLNMSLFSAIRSFCTLIRFTTENHPQGKLDSYIKIVVSMTPVRLLHLLCIAKALSTWSALDTLNKDNFFAPFELTDYLSYWNNVKDIADAQD